MKLKINVPYIKLRTTALAKRMVVAVGEFIAAIVRSDTAAATDLFSKRPRKNVSENAGFTDDIFYIPTKVITSLGAFFDGGDPPYFLQDYVVGGPDNQTYTLVGGFTKDITKLLQELPRAQETVAKTFARSINDGMFVTDDVNGAAAGDDQVTQYFKVLTEPAHINDVAAKNLSRALIDICNTTSAGSLSIQDYTVDMTYFLEDYVGTGRSWSYGRRLVAEGSSVSSSGVLFIQDYAESTYFLEDYVGISRSFT
jgi:hypothetical protein